MKRNLDLVGLLTLGCLALVSDLARAQQLPTPTGAYPVGTVIQNWTETSRNEAATSAPDDKREVAAQLWYPASATDAGGTPYMTGVDAMVAHVLADTLAPAWLAGQLAAYGQLRVHATPNALLASTDAPYPVLLFSPGGNMSRYYHSALAQELASYGYVVAVMSHAYSGWDVFARDGFVMSSSHWWGDEGMSEVDQQKMVETLNDALAGDARFVLDCLVEMNGERGGEFAGAFDLDRVAIAGHSRGGKTVSRACSTDPRFKAAIIYDNVGPVRERASGLKQPLLSMRTASDRWSDERVQALHDYLARTGSVAFEVVVDGASHNSFSDLPMIDFAHYPSDIDPARAHAIVAACTRDFLAGYLMSDDASLFVANGRRFPEIHVNSFGQRSGR